MGNLTQAAQSLDIATGVSVYTVTHFGIGGYDLRSSNLVNNFGGGTSLRVDKSNIKSTNAYVYDENGKLERPIVYSDFIGRLYHQNDTVENPSLNFITEEGFSKFESKIREINIRDNINDFYYNVSPEDYNTYIFGDYNPTRIPETSKIGDEYSINGHILHANHNSIKESNDGYASTLMFYTRKVSTSIGNNGLSSEGRFEYMGLVPSNLMDTHGDADIVTNHRDRNYINDKPKDIIEIGENERNKYYIRNYRYDFDYFERFRKFQELTPGLGNRIYGDIERLPEVPYLMATLGTYDIYEGSSEIRSILMGRNKSYTNNNQYAIGAETADNSKFDYFSVNEKVSDFISKVTKGKGGSTIDHYYREHDEGGSPDIKKGEKYVKAFIPGSGDEIGNYSKLIQRTNSLFYNQKIGSLINRFHTSSSDDLYNELITSKSKYGMSRGRNLLTKEGEKLPDTSTGYENPYCRVWTAHHQYGKINTLIRPFKGDYDSVSKVQEMYNGTELRTESGDTAFKNHTVLMDNGFVRITPTYNDRGDYSDDIKKCMFSIENLAWRDILIGEELSKEQRGPNKGRIMWFPPYNLKFTENVNVDWNANKFIGRGEQIYTYTNTDRSGTLSFVLLIDHPSIINKWRGRAGSVDDDDERENEILRFFAGCEPLTGYCGNGKDPKPEPEIDPTPNNPVMEGRTRKIALVLFFPNNFSAHNYGGDLDTALEKLSSYERGTGNNVWSDNEEDDDIENQVYDNVNRSIYNLNYSPQQQYKEQIKRTLFNNDENVEVFSFFDPNSGYTKLNQLIGDVNDSNATIFGEKGKNIRIELIEVKGCASSHGYANNNVKLGNRRRAFIKGVVDENCDNIGPTDFTELGPQTINVNDVGTENRDINSLEAKIARSAYVVFNIKWDDETTTNDVPLENGFSINGQNYDNVSENLDGMYGNMLQEVTVTSTLEDEYNCDNEYLYFANIAKTKDIAYERIIEKIRYFNPAYHSITPEGFNSRLTFLQQCTRQGPTMDLSSGNISSDSPNYLQYAGNLSFGRAPYCVLRIGDFFHTKICITSMSIDYDTGSGVQWDLNPEGVGVQPMYANVNINFNFIGGQDIAGPIERLQNAVTSNYYANASVYDKKADKKDKSKYVAKLKN